MNPKSASRHGGERGRECRGGLIRLVGGGSEKRKRTHLGQYAPATSNVQHVHALQHAARLERQRGSSSAKARVRSFVALHLKHLFADEAYTVRVHLVEEGELAAFVPP
jgi:hypothetical protein